MASMLGFLDTREGLIFRAAFCLFLISSKLMSSSSSSKNAPTEMELQDFLLLPVNNFNKSNT